MARLDGAGNAWCARHDGGAGAWLPVGEFAPRSKSHPGRLSCYCRRCWADHQVQYMGRNRESRRAKYRADAANRERRLTQCASAYWAKRLKALRYRLRTVTLELGVVCSERSSTTVSVITESGAVVSAYPSLGARHRAGGERRRKRAVAPGDIVRLRTVWPTRLKPCRQVKRYAAPLTSFADKVERAERLLDMAFYYCRGGFTPSEWDGMTEAERRFKLFQLRMTHARMFSTPSPEERDGMATRRTAQCQQP